MERINNEHDVGYKYLLSSKQIFVSLLKSFVSKGWINQIDEANLERVDKSYILPDFNEKEADLVYKMKIKNQDVIFYVLLELQSRVDYRMPYRLLAYMMEIWKGVLKESDQNAVKRKSFRLPVILPIVLYNGKYNWNAPLEFKDILNTAELFDDSAVNFRYTLIDINRYEKDELLKLSNLISAVFLLDQDMDQAEDFILRLKELMNTINQMNKHEYTLFKAWLKRIGFKRYPNQHHKELEMIIDNAKWKEADVMISNLENNFKRWFDETEEKAMEKGMEKGLEKGLEQGKKKAALDVAKRMLSKGMTKKEISELTQLSEDEIDALNEEMN